MRLAETNDILVNPARAQIPILGYLSLGCATNGFKRSLRRYASSALCKSKLPLLTVDLFDVYKNKYSYIPDNLKLDISLLHKDGHEVLKLCDGEKEKNGGERWKGGGAGGKASSSSSKDAPVAAAHNRPPLKSSGVSLIQLETRDL